MPEDLKGAVKAVHQGYAFRENEQGNRERITEGADDFYTQMDLWLDDAIKQSLTTYNAAQETSAYIASEETDAQAAIDRSADGMWLIDPIDGTGNFSDQNGSFGPIISYASNPDPTFDQVERAVFYDIPNDVVFYAEKGNGAYLIEDWAENDFDGEPVALQVSNYRSEDDLRLVIDEYMLTAEAVDGVIETLQDIAVEHTDYGCMGTDVAAVASMQAEAMITGDYCGENPDKHKTAEELAAFYLILSEAGGDGVMVDWDGYDIGNQKIGFHDGKPHDVIAANHPDVAEFLAGEIQDVIARRQ